WRQLTYADALTHVLTLATWMLERGLGRDRPMMLLSDNSIEHALLTLAAMHVGVPAVPVSPAYSLVAQDHAKLKAILASLRPAAIHAAPAARYAPALAATRDSHDAILVLDDPSACPAGAAGEALDYPALAARTDPARVATAYGRVGPDTIAKILFTSG